MADRKININDLIGPVAAASAEQRAALVSALGLTSVSAADVKSAMAGLAADGIEGPNLGLIELTAVAAALTSPGTQAAAWALLDVARLLYEDPGATRTDGHQFVRSGDDVSMVDGYPALNAGGDESDLLAGTANALVDAAGWAALTDPRTVTSTAGGLEINWADGLACELETSEDTAISTINLPRHKRGELLVTGGGAHDLTFAVGTVVVPGSLKDGLTVADGDVYLLTFRDNGTQRSVVISDKGEAVEGVVGITATGGTITDVEIGGVPYKLHTLTSSADFVVTEAPVGATIDILGVAAGGSGGVGGTSTCGGGGAGGEVRVETGVAVTETTYSAVIGSAGAAVAGANTAGNDGGDITFAGFTWQGGGGGAGGGTTNDDGRSGGSGGGGAGRTTSDTGLGGAATATGFGNAGGNGFLSAANDERGGGGGGGAGAVGGNATAGVAGSGGDGVLLGFTGASVRYGAGGGGSSRTVGTPGAGGAGGGGNGGHGALEGDAATAGTGLGAGGGGARIGSSGAGGSGVIYVRYLASS